MTILEHKEAYKKRVEDERADREKRRKDRQNRIADWLDNTFGKEILQQAEKITTASEETDHEEITLYFREHKPIGIIRNKKGGIRFIIFKSSPAQWPRYHEIETENSIKNFGEALSIAELPPPKPPNKFWKWLRRLVTRTRGVA